MNLARIVLAFLLALIATPIMATSDANGTLIQLPSFASTNVATRQISVWLPPGYAESHARYPVIYMHDGQNVFDPKTAYGGHEWGVDEALVEMKRAAIVIGVWNGPLRGREYFPEKLFALLPPAQQANVLKTHGGPPLGDAYLRFLVNELKPYIDRHYRTRAGLRDTAIMGSSMGGLISLYAMSEYPHVFGQAGCISIHWPLANPDAADPAAITAAWQTYLSHTGLRPGINRVYMDHGTTTLDAYYRPYSERVEKFMPALGWHRNRDWVSHVFDGAAHNESSWRARVKIPLAFLLKR